MYYSIVKKFLEKTKLTQDYIAYVANKLENEQLLCVCYDENSTELYYLENNKVKRFNGEKFVKEKDELAEYFLIKKIVNFYSDANYSIGRGQGKKDDFAIFNLAEAIINYKAILEFTDEDIDAYLENKKRRFDFENFKEKIEKNNLFINGDKNKFLEIMKNRFENLQNTQDFNTFAKVFKEFVKDEGILKKIFSQIGQKGFLFDDEKKIKQIQDMKKKKKEKFVENFFKKFKIRVLFVNKNIPIEENIDNFNKFYSLASKEIILVNDKIYYPFLIGSILKDKPMISKVNNIFEIEDNIFKAYFFMKYVLKITNIDELIEEFKKQIIITDPIYAFKNKEFAMISFDVLTNKKETINPEFVFYDLYTLLFEEGNFIDKINNFYVFLEIAEIILKTQKDFFLQTDIKSLNKKIFATDEEINSVFKSLLEEIINYEEFLLIDALKQKVDKNLFFYPSSKRRTSTQTKDDKNKYKKCLILYRLSLLMSIKSYLKGEKMQEVSSKLFYLKENFKEIVLRLKDDKKVELNKDLLSYAAGNTIKYFLSKRQGEKKISLIIPIFENVRSFKDAKDELDKAFVSYGYDEDFNSAALKVLALIKGVDNEVKVNKDYFLIGLLDKTDAFYQKSDKGEENE